MSVQLMTNDCFHGARSAVSLLVDALRELPMPRKRQHAVHILSCYVRPAAIKSLLEAVADQIRVTEVRILFDYSEVFAQGPMKLQKEFQEAAARLRHRHGITLEWRPIRPASGALVHAKAYGVAELNSQRTVEAGCLLFGSANATHRGLGLSHSNVELGSIATSRLEVERFFRLFQTLWEQETVSMDADLLKDQEELFRFALLSHGCFLSKWSGNLKSLLSIRYKLTDAGRKVVSVTDRQLSARGFDAEQSSLMKNYLRVPSTTARRDFPRSFSSNYTIESSLGRFCPAPIWEVVDKTRRQDDPEFLAGIQKCLSSRALDGAVKDASADLDFLRERDLVEGDETQLESWREKMIELRKNPARLFRVRHTFSDFALPFGREDVDEVGEVFDSIEDTISLCKRKNVAMRHFTEAVEERRLGPLELTDGERHELRQLFAPKSRKSKNGRNQGR